MNVWVICDTPAAFFNEGGESFVITKADLGKPVETPDWICKTILYGYLVNSDLIRIVPKPEEPEAEKPRKKPGKKK